MKNTLYQCFLAVVLLTVISCRKTNTGNPNNPVDSTNNPVKPDSGKYTNGFFLLNDTDDSTSRDVSYYSYDNDSLSLQGYLKENPGKSLGSSLKGAHIGYGTIYRDKLYVIIRNGPVIILNPATLKEIGRIENTVTMDARVFVGINENEALMSYRNGIARVSLTNPKIGTRIKDVSGVVPQMVRAGDYIFAFSLPNTIYILNVKDYSVVKKITPANGGFTVSKDGNVWAVAPLGKDMCLLKINPVTLNMDTVPVPFHRMEGFDYLGGYGNSSYMAASTRDNIIFVVSVRAVWCCIIGKTNVSFKSLFSISYHEGYVGNMVNYDPAKNQLLILTIDFSVQGAYKNVIYFCDPNSGTVQKSMSYDERAWTYWPVMTVFH